MWGHIGSPKKQGVSQGRPGPFPLRSSQVHFHNKCARLFLHKHVQLHAQQALFAEQEGPAQALTTVPRVPVPGPCVLRMQLHVYIRIYKKELPLTMHFGSPY